MPTIRTLNAEVVGDTLNLQEQETDLATTPLAEVSSTSTPTTVIVVDNGAVRQIPVSELLAPILTGETGTPTWNTEIATNVRYVSLIKYGRLAHFYADVDVTGQTDASILCTLPTGFIPFGGDVSMTEYPGFTQNAQDDVCPIRILSDGTVCAYSSASAQNPYTGRAYISVVYTV